MGAYLRAADSGQHVGLFCMSYLLNCLLGHSVKKLPKAEFFSVSSVCTRSEPQMSPRTASIRLFQYHIGIVLVGVPSPIVMVGVPSPIVLVGVPSPIVLVGVSLRKKRASKFFTVNRYLELDVKTVFWGT